MEIPIIFEDEFLMVVDKPTGIAVNRSENEKTATIQDWTCLRLGFPLRQGYEGQVGGQAEVLKEDGAKSDFVSRAGIVHRLDKDTSGLLIVAKNEESFKHLQQQFFDKQVEKTYTALVHGMLSEGRQTINAPVGRLPWNRRKFGVIVEGRSAETVIETVKYFDFKNNKYTLIKAYPKTGRTHQIRIHLKHIGHTIVSDPLYAGRKVLKEDNKVCPRLFLHASILEFMHPETGIKLILESKLPQDLSSCMTNIDKTL